MIAIFGAGTMGAGIAALAIGHGVPVVLIDVDETTVRDAVGRVHDQVRHGALVGAFPETSTPGVLTTGTGPGDVVGADLVIEAITEDVTLKGKLLAEVADVTPPGTPLVSNTSGIPIDELACAVPDPARLVGAHFMNPTYLIAATEVIRGPRTGDATLAAVCGLLERLGRKTIVVRDAPGFVTSRLLHPMINDAARIVESGTATVEQVDELMRDCIGHAVGPLRTADLIGLDNLADALRALAERTGVPEHAPCELLLAKVADGRLGRKSGEGFYDYRKVLS
ncbi:3-hydroxyacyl-CoA dehydrogenase family protein [Kibdelosporangium aridum]|uniref:3-hydroxyacyl-CoA dehydrogenase family protein n=1 Tax=Kibdelosporangium aridum TaxID=2030 RepID=UPI0005267719